MPIYNRKTLKNFFKNGSNPKEVHFSYLIDSSVNKIDDGFSKTVDDGLRLSPLGTSNNLVSMYSDVKDNDPEWQISINPNENAQGLSFADKKNNPRLFLHENGNIGINTLSPRSRLDVRGTSTLHTRVGGYKIGQVPADGKWHTIIDKLTDCHVFEVVAKVGARKARGKYAIAHAIATGVYGQAHSKVKVTQSYFGWWLNKLKFRWQGNPSSYQLQIKTNSHYGPLKGESNQINYHICSLYNDRMFIGDSE